MSPQDFMNMDKGELVCFSLEQKPIRLKSMYARRHPQLMERFGQTPPERERISPTVESPTDMPSAPKPPPLESWHYDPQLFRKWPQFTDERGVGEYTRDVDQGNERSLGL
jgi:type IV secretory pathway TraG/TraD family ATPase VirD4